MKINYFSRKKNQLKLIIMNIIILSKICLKLFISSRRFLLYYKYFILYVKFNTTNIEFYDEIYVEFCVEIYVEFYVCSTINNLLCVEFFRYSVLKSSTYFDLNWNLFCYKFSSHIWNFAFVNLKNRNNLPLIIIFQTGCQLLQN